jgi:hypothetical protein
VSSIGGDELASPLQGLGTSCTGFLCKSGLPSHVGNHLGKQHCLAPNATGFKCQISPNFTPDPAAFERNHLTAGIRVRCVFHDALSTSQATMPASWRPCGPALAANSASRCFAVATPAGGPGHDTQPTLTTRTRSDDIQVDAVCIHDTLLGTACMEASSA